MRLANSSHARCLLPTFSWSKRSQKLAIACGWDQLVGTLLVVPRPLVSLLVAVASDNLPSNIENHENPWNQYFPIFLFFNIIPAVLSYPPAIASVCGQSVALPNQLVSSTDELRRFLVLRSSFLLSSSTASSSSCCDQAGCDQLVATSFKKGGNSCRFTTFYSIRDGLLASFSGPSSCFFFFLPASPAIWPVQVEVLERRSKSGQNAFPHNLFPPLAS